MKYSTIEDLIGKTPLVRLQRIGATENAARGNVILGKLEGNNPAGSVKDRAAMSMIRRAEERSEIKPGDTLIEATSGNTGIALAMAAAIKGYRMVLIMPEDLSIERAQTMKAFGAELILTPKSGGMEYSRDLADQMAREGKGRVLDQFANADNPRIHVETTGPEIWADTKGKITHFVSAMGTTGTITGVSQYLKKKNPAIKIIGVQPTDGSRIPGIRKWPQAYLPKIYDPTHVDELLYVSQEDAEEMCRQLAREEGIFAGISAAGACWVAREIARREKHATIVFIVCDRGDRYLSTGVFPADTAPASKFQERSMHIDKEIDTSGLNCPLPILKAKKALAELESGQVLKVIATDSGSLRDFQAFARQTGNELLEQQTVGEEFIHVLRRR